MKEEQYIKPKINTECKSERDTLQIRRYTEREKKNRERESSTEKSRDNE